MKTQKQFSQIKVKEIMSENVQTLLINDTIKDALTTMLEQELTTIPVVNLDNRCVGIISRSDLTELFVEEDGELSRMIDTPLSMERLFRSLETCDIRQIRELMTHEVISVKANQSLTEACQQMVRQNVHHLPVVDDEGRLAGIVSSFDVVQAVAETDQP